MFRKIKITTKLSTEISQISHFTREVKHLSTVFRYDFTCGNHIAL